MTDADWQKQTTIQKGLAWSVQGYVDISRKLNAQAVTALQTGNRSLSNVRHGRDFTRFTFRGHCPAFYNGKPYVSIDPTLQNRSSESIRAA